MRTSLIPTAGLLVFVTAIASVLLPISSDATQVRVSFREKRGTRRPDVSPPDAHAGEAGVEVSEYSVRCLVESRYARTWARLQVVNVGPARRLVPLQLPVPASAFVSNFSVVVGNKTYVSRVRERAQQKAAVHKHSYNDTGPRGWHVLRASVPVPAGARAVLAITHEALLQRRLGRYEVALSMRPGVAARSLRLHVELAESAGISELTVLPLRAAAGPATAARRHETGQAPEGTAVERSATRARVRYEPTAQQRRGLSAAERLGEFVVCYDVSRHLGVGDIQVRDGYFVHYFAPTDLPAVPKDVVFVIDTSGSMIGTKIGQTKDAMQTILKELRTGDRFNVVTFSERVRVWRPGRMVEVTRDAVRDARKYIYLASPAGGTNINAALLTGARLLARPAAPADERVSLLVFLTDGQPTAGDTDRVAIVTQARAAAAQGRFCIFSLGFGADADFALLDALAAGSCGVARRVYDGADASAQLKGFYDEIGTPVLADVRVAYPDGGVRDLTQSVFPNYFNGSELVVAGRLAGNGSGGGAAPFSGDALRVQVSARAAGNRLRVEGDVALQRPSAPGGTGTGHGNGTEEEEEAAREPLTPRLWAFLTIKELLKTRLRDPLRGGGGRGNSSTAGTGGAAAPPRSSLDATQRAIDLSLQHHFLTPVTSLVMEEEDEGEEDAHEAGAGEERTRDGDGQDKDEEEDEEEAEEGPEDVGGLDGTQFALPAAYLATEEEEAAAAAESGARADAKPAKLSADGDPHFVVELPRSALTVCFNIDGEPGHVLRLVDDHGHSGVTVNGQLVGSPAPPGSRKRRRTYFGTVALVSERPRRAYVLVTPTRVVLDGAERLVLPCDRSASARRDGLAVAVAAGTSVTVTLLGNITFVIQLHLYKRPASFQRDHLGVYILSGGSLSPHTHGLLGQFLHARATVVVAETPAPAAATVVAGATTTAAGTGNRDETEEEAETEEEDREERAGATATAPGLSANATPAVPAAGAGSPATLNIGGRRLPVTARVRRTHGSGGPRDVACWFARSNARGLVQGCYADYVARDLYDFRSGGGGDCGEGDGEDYGKDDGNFA